MARGVIATMAAIPMVIVGAAFGGCDSVLVVTRPPSLSVALPASVELYPGLTVEVRSTDGTEVFSIDDFSANSVPGRAFVTDTIQLGSVGEVTVTAMLSVDGAPIASGALSFQSAVNTHWLVLLIFNGADPSFECSGCVDSHPIPVPPEFQRDPGDDLWILLIRNEVT